jgi:hypothetical protein
MSRSRLAAAVWILGLGAVVAQVLALSARYFQPWLSSDYIYPQLFAEDVLAGRYPLSGWTLSSAPYLFPDMAGAIVLRVLGGAGTILPAYVVFSYVALAVLAGWSLQCATRTGWAAWLGGVALVNGLLLWQPVTDHAHYLWLLGTVGFHGGAILLGLANFALWTGANDHGLPRGRWLVALAVLVLGSISDTLFLTQAVLPLGVGLWAQAGWQWRHPRLLAYGKTLLLALGLVAVVRVALALTGWFSFSKVVRYAPTPSAIGGATAAFGRDLLATLVPGAWGFLIVAAGSLLLVGFLWRRECRQRGGVGDARKRALGFGLTGLAATTLMPLVTAYWRDAQHVRYILPWLVWPGWLALAWLLPAISRWGEDRRALLLTGAVWVGVMALSLPRIQASALRWPYSEQQARLDEFLSSRRLRYGLSDYWHAHTINTLARAPVHLFALRPQANVGFWNNNAFRFYEADPATHRLNRPDYSFIITDGLDESALLGRFGEPTSRERVGELTIWLYSGQKMPRLASQVEPEVRNFLRGRPGEGRIDAQP